MPATAPRWPYPRRVAHRGGGTLAPENTLAAFEVGASLGYEMFEFDVKLSADGVAVLMHDDTVDRTTDGHGSVAGMSFDALARLDAGRWHSPRFAGEGIATFAKVAAFLRARELHADIEIKPGAGLDAQTGAAVARAARAAWTGAALAPLLSSFSEPALEAAADAAPELPRALLFERLAEGRLADERLADVRLADGRLLDDRIARCRALGCVAIAPHHADVDAAWISRAHDAGLAVVCYTVNDPSRVSDLEGWGVDCVITDAIDRIAARP